MSNRATYDLSSIRLAASAAEPLPADIYRRWRDRFGIEILDGIGQRHPCFVLATGGSLVSETGTFERLLRSCFTVWVRASPEEHMQGDMRPMANNRDAMSDLRRFLAEREVLYG